MQKPEIGSGCMRGEKCCRFLGTYNGSWWWLKTDKHLLYHGPEGDFSASNVYIPIAELPAALLHNYAFLKLGA